MPDTVGQFRLSQEIKNAVLRSGKEMERTARGLIRKLHPRLMAHNLRWHLRSRRYLAQWTQDRLELDGNFWLFILGLNNSGTTLLADLLKSHPNMRWLPNEGQYLTGALPQARAHGVARKFSQRMDVFHWTEASDPAPALRIQYDWAPHYQRRPGILLEKSPPNTLRSRWLQHHFRPSRFVAIIRHPYAVCEGIRRREGFSIADAALHWTRAHEQMLDDMTRLQHCLCFTYEDLCARPADHLLQLQRFLGLEVPFHPNVLATPRRIHNIDRSAELIRDFNSRSLQQLSASDLAVIDRIAGPLMERLGYQRFAHVREQAALAV
jgi:Sulfotransferase family